jgi:large repetitive protein
MSSPGPRRRLIGTLMTALLATVGLWNTARASGQPPTANSDRYVTPVGRTLTVVAPGVLANDTDPEFDPLEAEVTFGPQFGTLDLRPDGSFTYVPRAGHEGYDHFWYRAWDGSQFSYATFVTINVNGPPRAVADGYAVLRNHRLVARAPGVLDNDVDRSGDPLTAHLVRGPNHGRLRLAPGGRFVFRPRHGFVGTDTFLYRARDGRRFGNRTTVTIRVKRSNRAPVAVGPDRYVSFEDTVVNIRAPGVLANDRDRNRDYLRARLVQPPAAGVEELTFRADGSFSIVPVQHFDGDILFTYAVTDGIATSAPATINVYLNAVNDLPTAIDDDFEVYGFEPLEVEPPGVLANDEDVENDLLSVRGVVTPPRHGTVDLRTDGSFRYQRTDPDATFDSFSYQVQDAEPGSVASVNIVIYD